MKKIILIVLLLSVVLPAVGQKIKPSPTDDFLHKNDTTYQLKKNRNEFSCDFELLLSASGNYKRKISNKTSIGVTMGLGFALVNVWNREGNLEPVTNLEKVTQKMEIEGFKIGLVINHQLIRKLYYEFSPQITSFFNHDTGGDSFFGIKNSLFFSIKGAYLGLSSFIGTIVINQTTDTGFIIYTSLIILRVPLKQW